MRLYYDYIIQLDKINGYQREQDSTFGRTVDSCCNTARTLKPRHVCFQKDLSEFHHLTCAYEA